jgi:SNF2 family DNA or RNA helicase
MNRIVVASQGAAGRTVVLRPLKPVTLRQLERTLSQSGVAPVVARPLNKLCVSYSEFGVVQKCLVGWHVRMDEGLAQQIETDQQRGNEIRKAKISISESLHNKSASPIWDFPGGQRLDPHQLRALSAIVGSGIDGICLFDEQGLGKTITALAAFHHLHFSEVISRMLVIAPKNMIFEWVSEAEKFLGRSYIVQPVHGTERDKRAALKKKADVYVTNYETAIQLSIALRNVLLNDGGRGLLVLDESFFVKNARARRTQAVHVLRAVAAKCFVLCGTPAPNSPADIVEQVNIADNGTTFGGVTLPGDPKQRAEIIALALRDRGPYIRRLKRDVLPELPKKNFSEIPVPMQPHQLKLYRSRLESLVDDLKNSSDADFDKNRTSFLAKRLRLLQICSHPGAVHAGYSEVPGKVLALDGLLQEHIEEHREKVVVWSFFRFSLEEIFKRYQRYSPIRIDGSISSAELRSESIRHFQDDDSTMLLIASPAAAAAGITLTRSRVAIYESFSIQTAHYMQSLDRIHRRGQTREVSYYMLLCENSIEEGEYTRLLSKEQDSRELFRDDDSCPQSREVFLGELLSAWRKL